MAGQKTQKSSATKTARKTSVKNTPKSFLNRRRNLIVSAFAACFVLLAGIYLVASQAASTSSLWGNTSTPRNATSSDTNNSELGLRFQSDVTGYVTGVRFYKSNKNTGTHTGNLWDNTGKLLASVTFQNETSSGWQNASFSQPVSIAANVPYVVSYHAPKGRYSQTNNYFTNGSYVKGHLKALQSTASAPNGTFAYGSNPSIFPTSSGNGANYWVDVKFTTQIFTAQGPAAPANVTATAQSSSTVGVMWNASVSANPISEYLVFRNGAQVGSAGTNTAYTDNNLTASTSYSYQVQAVDNTGLKSALSSPASVTTQAASTGGTSGSCTFPNPSCTGVPANVTLSSTVNGDYDVTQSGQVIDGVHITGDLNIKTTNVTIKNSQIDGTVNNEFGGLHYSPFTITDSTVGPVSGCIGQPGIGEDGYIATRVHVRGHDDGFRVSGNNITIQDSYFHQCSIPSSHADGIQSYCPDAACQNLTMTHNTLDGRNADSNRAVFLTDPHFGGIVNIKNNLFAAGGYVIDLQWYAGPNYTVQNNHIVDKTWSYAPVTTQGTCSHQDWSGNDIVTIDSSYNITSTVRAQTCTD